MNKKYIFIATGIVINFLITVIYVHFATPKVAYVKSGYLVDNYLGMKEARSIYKEKMDQWQANIDTLQQDYQKAVSNYQLNTPKYSAKEKEKVEEALKRQEVNIRTYVGSLEKKAAEEDTKMTEGVLNQINSYIQEYGKKKGYDVIMGITNNGNILYGSEGHDITEEVLHGLNEEYKGGKIEKQ